MQWGILKKKIQPKRNGIKRLNDLKIAYNGPFASRVKKNAGFSVEFIDDDDVFDLQNLSEAHLETLVNILRERHWNSVSERIFGCLILSILKVCHIPRTKIEHILRTLNSICYKTAELYANKLVNSDFDALTIDNRGRYHRYSVFEFFPDLKDHLHEFVVDRVSQKTSFFNIKMCIDESHSYLKRSLPDYDYSEIINTKSIQNLLENWGFKYSNNKARPFINGHEREDVVLIRKDFVDYFAFRKGRLFYL